MLRRPCPSTRRRPHWAYHCRHRHRRHNYRHRRWNTHRLEGGEVDQVGRSNATFGITLVREEETTTVVADSRVPFCRKSSCRPNEARLVPPDRAVGARNITSRHDPVVARMFRRLPLLHPNLIIMVVVGCCPRRRRRLLRATIGDGSRPTGPCRGTHVTIITAVVIHASDRLPRGGRVALHGKVRVAAPLPARIGPKVLPTCRHLVRDTP